MNNLFLAPEVYQGETYTDKSDIFSLSIVLWEITARTIMGKYVTPYEEYGFKFDWQILMGVSQHQQRPTFPATTPNFLREVCTAAMDSDPTKRPNIDQLLEGFLKLYGQYRDNQDEWNHAIVSNASTSLESKEKISSSIESVKTDENSTGSLETPRENISSEGSIKM